MNARRDGIAVVGLPGAGKTTLLAALWHLVNEDQGTDTSLRFGRLAQGNYEHLNAIRKLWRSGRVQVRTALAGGMRTVVMELVDANGAPVGVYFPDAPGEEYRRMWEERSVDDALATALNSSMIVLLVNGDRIEFPHWVAHRAEIIRQAEASEAEAGGVDADRADGASAEEEGRPPPQEGDDAPVDWSPAHAPTQVQVVDLLQHLMRPPLDRGPRRLALLVSSWDQIRDEQITPSDLVRTKLPLLDQYLRSGRDPWSWQVWGVSAQGGEYDDPERDLGGEDADRLRGYDRASDRIEVVGPTSTSSDLTEPLAWLLG